MRPLLLAIFLLGVAGSALAQGRGPADPAELEAFLDSVIRPQMKRLHIPGAAVAVVRGDRILVAKGYGWADLAARRPVEADRTVFPVGSVAKPVTATAVMQLVERRKLGLGDDVSRSLRSLRLAGSPPVSAAHLLTHTAGFDISLIGVAAPSAAEIRPLGPWLSEHLPPRVRPPGRVLAYSNHGYTLLGLLVEDVSGLPFPRAVERSLFHPLGMHRTGFDWSGLASDLAVGYERRSAGLRKAPPVHPQIGPAAGLATTATDMARFMIAHLNGGVAGGQRILEPSTVQEMQRRHFGQDPRMPGVALGFFESFENEERILFHGGGSRGFTSGIYLWPEHRVGLFVANNLLDDGLIWALAHRFADHYFPGKPRRPLVPLPGAEERARLCAGRYRLASAARTNLEKAAALRDRDFVVRDLGRGALGLWGLRFVEVEPYLFQVADGKERVAFVRDSEERVLWLVTEDLFVGNQTWERVSWRSAGSLHRDVLLLLLALFAVGLVVRPPIEAASLSLEDRPKTADPPAARKALRLAAVLSGLNLLFLVLMILGFRQAAQGAGLLYGVPPVMTAALLIPLAGLPLALVLPVYAVRSWREGYWSIRWRVYYTLLALGGLAFPAFLWFWNLLGFHG